MLHLRTFCGGPDGKKKKVVLGLGIEPTTFSAFNFFTKNHYLKGYPTERAHLQRSVGVLVATKETAYPWLHNVHWNSAVSPP